MKKILTAFIATLLSCLLLFAFVGCSEKKDKGLRGGFDSGGCDPAPPIKVGFTSEHSKIKIGSELEIKLFYGRVGSYTGYDPAPERVTATVTMWSGVYGGDFKSANWIDDLESPRKELLIKEIDDFVNDSYKWVSNTEQTGGIETIIIPGDWFDGNAGAISWAVNTRIVFPSDSSCEDITEVGSASLYYIKKGEDIVLFGNFYDFFNYRR